MLKVNNLKAQVDDEKILKGIDLTLSEGEIHAIMGPNGSGKSTLAKSLMGHPTYEITSGEIILDEEDITEEEPNERAQEGLFLSLQYPPEIGGVSITNFLKTATQSITGEEVNPVEFHNQLKEKMEDLGIDTDFANRNVNEGFSGGEKKKSEILQLSVLDPKYAILDETDSGLDVDALKIVADGINDFHSEDNGILLITHYKRILEFVQPDSVHIMKEGKIVKSGDKSLAQKIEDQGYEQF
jgi:Fe-S cluster assembly ATP-binding protein